MQNERNFLLQCIELAKYRLGFCAPNPAVGCVIVKNNAIIAEGVHWGCGHPHAEVEALNKIGEAARGATLYVSLEPCCHYGRTPPCTERIKQAGIANVVFGLQDPNPIVTGRGQQALSNAGIPCEHRASQEIDEFYVPYVYWTTTKMPYVMLKLAVSKDYKIAHKHGKTAIITGKECSEFTHHIRKESDAILTTVHTIINDDPKMNARINHETIAKNIYVLDSTARLPLSAMIFNTARSITVFHSSEALSDNIMRLQNHSVRCVCVSNNNFGLDLMLILKEIGTDGVHQLWIEGGAQCTKSFLSQQLLQEMILYVSPHSLGDDAMSADIRFDALKREYALCDQRLLGADQLYHFKRH